MDGDRRLRRIARAGKQWKRTLGRRVDMEGEFYAPNIVLVAADRVCSVSVCLSVGAGVREAVV